MDSVDNIDIILFDNSTEGEEGEMLASDQPQTVRWDEVSTILYFVNNILYVLSLYKSNNMSESE